MPPPDDPGPGPDPPPTTSSHPPPPPPSPPSSSSSYVHIHVGPVRPASPLSSSSVPPSVPSPVPVPAPASVPQAPPAPASSLPTTPPAQPRDKFLLHPRPRSNTHTHSLSYTPHLVTPRHRPVALSLPSAHARAAKNEEKGEKGEREGRASVPVHNPQPEGEREVKGREGEEGKEGEMGKEGLLPPHLSVREVGLGSGSTLVANDIGKDGAELGLGGVNEKVETSVVLDAPPRSSSPSKSESPSPSKIEPTRETEFIEQTKDLHILPIPRHLRFHPDRPFRFGLGLNVAFGVASTFIVSNLYYNQPLLIQLSASLHVPLTRVSAVPALTQAGYAVGLVFISPLGDILPRRPLILLTISLSTLLTLGLCMTRSARVFEGVSFAVGVCTVTPQILIPLAADLAPPARRASAISVVLSGLLFGILIARVLSGVIAGYASWRVVYYYALSVQALVLVGAYWLLPAYPAKNSRFGSTGGKEGSGNGEERMTYFGVLKSMTHFAHTEPLLVQCTLVNLCSAAAFANFWVTLTFLLGGEGYGYGYSTLVIGLFGLIGMAGVAFGPVVGYVIDRLVPWYASLFAVLGSLVFQAIYAAAGTRSVGAVVVACFGLDVFRQMLQVSLTTAAFSISTAARARLNAILILGIFIGQVTGTALGSYVFLRHGFLPNAGLNLGLMGLQLLLLAIRGPGLGRYGWFGWAKTREGWEWRRARVAAAAQARVQGQDHAQAQDLAEARDTPPGGVSGGAVENDTSMSLGLVRPRGVKGEDKLKGSGRSPLSFGMRTKTGGGTKEGRDGGEKEGLASMGAVSATDSHPGRLLDAPRGGGDGKEG